MSLARDECFSIIQKAFTRALRKKKTEKRTKRRYKIKGNFYSNSNALLTNCE